MRRLIATINANGLYKLTINYFPDICTDDIFYRATAYVMGDGAVRMV